MFPTNAYLNVDVRFTKLIVIIGHELINSHTIVN